MSWRPCSTSAAGPTTSAPRLRSAMQISSAMKKSSSTTRTRWPASSWLGGPSERVPRMGAFLMSFGLWSFGSSGRDDDIGRKRNVDDAADCVRLEPELRSAAQLVGDGAIDELATE